MVFSKNAPKSKKAAELLEADLDFRKVYPKTVDELNKLKELTPTGFCSKIVNTCSAKLNRETSGCNWSLVQRYFITLWTIQVEVIAKQESRNTQNVILTLENDATFYNARPPSLDNLAQLIADSTTTFTIWVKRNSNIMSEDLTNVNWDDVKTHFQLVWNEELNESSSAQITYATDPYHISNLCGEITLPDEYLCNLTTQNGETQMNPTCGTAQSSPPKVFEERQLLNGNNMAHMSDDEIFQAIAAMEEEAKTLSKIETKSTKLAERIEEINANIQKVVAVLDAR